MRSIPLLAVLVPLVAGCNRPAVPDRTEPGPAPAPVQEVDPCTGLIEEFRALRDGPQPCAGPGDCTIWNKGHYYDGCAPEVNKENAARMDELRDGLEEAGCQVEVDRACAPLLVRGCMQGQCGKPPRYQLKLTPAQQKTYDELRSTAPVETE